MWRGAAGHVRTVLTERDVTVFSSVIIAVVNISFLYSFLCNVNTVAIDNTTVLSLSRQEVMPVDTHSWFAAILRHHIHLLQWSKAIWR